MTFPERRGIEIDHADGQPITRIDGKVEMVQLEAGVGYYVFPWLGPYVGLMSQRQEFEFNTNQSALLKGDQNFDVPLVGVLFNFPVFGPRTSFWGNSSFVGFGSGDVKGWSQELGFAYVAQQTPLSFSGAFKFQYLRYEKDVLTLNGNPRKRDILLGPSAGIHYTF